MLNFYVAKCTQLFLYGYCTFNLVGRSFPIQRSQRCSLTSSKSFIKCFDFCIWILVCLELTFVSEGVWSHLTPPLWSRSPHAGSASGSLPFHGCKPCPDFASGLCDHWRAAEQAPPASLTGQQGLVSSCLLSFHITFRTSMPTSTEILPGVSVGAARSP